MAKTFAQIKSDVGEIVLDLNAEVLGNIPDYIRDAQAELEDERMFKVLETDWTTTLASGAQTLTKPSDWNGERLPPYRLENDGAAVPIATKSTVLKSVTDAWVIGNFGTDDTGIPRYYVDTSETAYTLYPIADALGPWTNDYKVVAPYWKRLSTLTLDSDTNWFCDNTTNYLIWTAAARGMDFNEDPKFIKQSARAMNEKRRVKRAFAQGRFPRNFTIKPRVNNRLGSRF